jgi:hypothetical protein
MPPSKVVNVDEARRWILQGKSYPWIIHQYRIRYGVQTTPAMWSNFRRRQGIEIRTTRDGDLIPWRVAPQHRGSYLLEMLRKEARIRAGNGLNQRESHRLALFKENLAGAGNVVHYEPASGFRYVPRRPGVDLDMIREPARRTKMTRVPD